MKEALKKTAFVILLILLVFDIGSRLIAKTPVSVAAPSTQYRTVVASGDSVTAKGFETLCNQMASQGWRYVDTNNAFGQYWFTFVK